MAIDNAVPFLDQLVNRFQASGVTEPHPAQLFETVLGIYRSIALGDYDSYRHLVTAGFELEIIGPKDLPLIGVWRGRDDVMKAVRHNFTLLESQLPEVISVTVDGEAVVVMGREVGRVKATGKAYTGRFIHWFTFHGDVVTRVLEIIDSDDIGQAFLPA